MGAKASMQLVEALKRGALIARVSLMRVRREARMFKNLLMLAVLGGIGYGCYAGYERYQASRTALDLGESAMTAHEYDDASSYLEQALREEPSNMRIMLMLGEAYVRTNRKPEAAAMYRMAQTLLNDPEQSVSMRRHRERYAVLQGEGY